VGNPGISLTMSCGGAAPRQLQNRPGVIKARNSAVFTRLLSAANIPVAGLIAQRVAAMPDLRLSQLALVLALLLTPLSPSFA
jgi:hypothetical protein